MRLSATFCCVLLFPVLSSHASGSVSSGSQTVRPVIEAVRVTNPIVLDGKLTESEWLRPGATDFTQRDPAEGAPPTYKTEVWVAYDDEALYIAARLYDASPDSIVSRIGRRDASLIADEFLVGIDSYHDRRTGYYFGVYSGGTMTDGTMFNDSWDDNTWDGVWSAVTVTDEHGWVVEMKIPYSQIRFPKLDSYVWGINFTRQIARKHERDDFVMVPKKESGWVSRFADLTGIANIHPPLKLEILPYVVSTGKFLQHDPGNPFVSGHDFNQNAGADIRLGLGSNLTINATLNPDFGQVEVDPAVVNLTQYETYFDEKRPFFVDGSNFFDFGFGGTNSNWGFNFGTPTFFYSRRIGRPPESSTQHTTDDGRNDMFYDVPDRTHILGAAKLTGKVSDGWSVASMQAVTKREYAVTDSAGTRFTDVVEPLSYYGVVRSLREFNDGRQAIGFIGTAMMRDLNREYLVDNYDRRAFSLGVDGWTNLDADQVWVSNIWLAGTNVAGSPTRMITLQRSPLHYYQRSGLRYLSVDSSATSLDGFGGRISLNKQKGNSYFNAALGFISPGFDLHNLGFQYRTDVINGHLVLGYTWYEPDGVFRSKGFNIAGYRSYAYGRTTPGFGADQRLKTGAGYMLFWNGQFLNYWRVSGNFSYSPEIFDLTRTRGGPPTMTPRNYGFNAEVTTDSRNALQFDFSFGGWKSDSGGSEIWFGPGIYWKPTSGLSISWTPSIDINRGMAQYVTTVADPAAAATGGNRYVFSTLDQREISASIRVDWTFTPRLSLQIYLQPLFSVGSYHDFKELKQPATFTFNTYGTHNDSLLSYDAGSSTYTVTPAGGSAFSFSNPDFNFKSLRGNAILRWEYLPGSTLYFVWTRQGINTDNPGSMDLSRDFSDLLRSPVDNAFVIKATYWWHP